jgi:hypothetical protein
MKKHMMRVVNANIFSKFFKAAVLVVSLTGSYAASYAAPASHAVVAGVPGFGNAVVNHLSTDNESFLFEVKLKNTSGERFTVIVKDEIGNTLYRGWFSETEFNKKFRLPKLDSEKITFIIRTESGKASETFEVNSSRRVVEDVVVKKVL